MMEKLMDLPTKGKLRKYLSADALIAALHPCFESIDVPGNNSSIISTHDALMSGFAMMSLKDPSLLAFDRRRVTEEHNLRSIYAIKNIPCDTQMRTRLDEINPDLIRPAYKTFFNNAQRGKLLEPMVFMNGCYLLACDGTGYFSSSKLYSPYCLKKTCSKTGKTTYHLQALGAAIIHPESKEVIPLAPEFICNQDGQSKNDCERNAASRWLIKFRQDHPNLKVIMTEDALSPNAPHIRDLMAARCHFILTVKESDHTYLFRCFDEAVEEGKVTEYDMQDPKNEKIRHYFRFYNGLSLNASNKDVIVNLLEYWEVKDDKIIFKCSWVTDLPITTENCYTIMRGGRAHWKIENETFNTLKNQGYHLEHNYGLGEKHLSTVFFSLMMLAFLMDQLLQMACPLFRAIRKKAGSKRELWEKIRSVFHLFLVESMEMIYRILLFGPQKIKPIFIDDTS